MFATDFTYLGTLTPSFSWQTFPNVGINGKSLRIVFGGISSDQISKIWSACLLRRHIATQPDSSFTKPFVVVPSLDAVVMSNSYPFFEELGWFVYDWQIKLKINRRRYGLEEPIYDVSLYES